MKKNKKLIIGIIIAIVVIAVIGIALLFANNGGEGQENKPENTNKNYGIDSLESLNNKLLEIKNYSFKTELNEENYKKTSRNNESLQLEIDDEGKKQTYIVNKGNTYLFVDSTKKYYKYENNTSMLNELENKVSNLQKDRFEVGTVTIEGKDYTYQEYEKTSAFLINYKKNINNNKTKTRFYFANGNLQYIKTYVGQIEQLLKVELEFNNQNGQYKVPEGFSK